MLQEMQSFLCSGLAGTGSASMPKLPTMFSSHAATQVHRKTGVTEITVACCSCLIRDADALGSLKVSPTAVLP